MPDAATIEKTVSSCFAAIRDGDLDAYLSRFADDVVAHDPVGAPPHQGKEALRGFFEQMDEVFEELALHEESVFVAGDCAAVKWSGEGTGRNGVHVEFEGIDVFEVNDQGRVQTLRAYWNPDPVMEQVTS